MRFYHGLRHRLRDRLAALFFGKGSGEEGAISGRKSQQVGGDGAPITLCRPNFLSGRESASVRTHACAWRLTGLVPHVVRGSLSVAATTCLAYCFVLCVLLLRDPTPILLTFTYASKQCTSQLSLLVAPPPSCTCRLTRRHQRQHTVQGFDRSETCPTFALRSAESIRFSSARLSLVGRHTFSTMPGRGVIVFAQLEMRAEMAANYIPT